jgi:triacylglycerol lipase
MLGDDKRIYLEEIAPPYLKYSYFKDAHQESLWFRPDATGFDMVNAWWLCEASILSYMDEEFVRKEFAKVNLTEVEFFSRKSTQCYVASNNDFLILVFRGTEIWGRPGETNPFKIIRAILSDIIADAKIKLVDSGQGGNVHRGFKEALEEVWKKKGLVDYLKSKDKDGRTFWFTGHSLGAALATLAWKRYNSERKVHGLYTYGSPRVGDRDFGEGFQLETYRFVNNNDIVTMVPPRGDYQHVGTLKYINSKGVIDTGSKAAAAGENGFRTGIRSLLNSREGINDIYAIIQKTVTKFSSFLNKGGVINATLNTLLPGAILDHVPILYSNHIKKNIPKV